MFTLTLDGHNAINKEVDAMRKQRELADKDYVWNITLQKKEGPILHVRAKGPNLWVEEYSTDDGPWDDDSWEQKTWHKFGDIHPAFSMNYEEGDSGCMLNAEQIIGLIENFVRMAKAGPLDYTTKKQQIRCAYVIIVYVASEMIRNEILERAMYVTSYECKRDPHSWVELEFLCKNFKSLSTKLYKTTGEYYPTIYIDDFVAMSVRLAGDPNADKALNIIKSFEKPVDSSLLN